jgi:hypothetical protein
VLDNHFHAIVAAPEQAKTIADLKKFTAREIVAQLQSEGREWLLDQLRYFAPHTNRRAPISFGRKGAIRSDYERMP